MKKKTRLQPQLQPGQCDIDFIASRLKECFIAEKKQLNNGFKLSARHNAPDQWRKTAEVVVELGADPVSYIRAVFQHCRLPGGPFGNALAGPSARSAWHHYSKTHGVKMELNLTGCYTVATDYSLLVSDQWDWIRREFGHARVQDPEVLAFVRDPTTLLESWFRILIRPDDPVVWERYSLEGVLTLKRNPVFAQYLSSLSLPVAAIVQRIHAQ